jgi:hypothetical protein
MSYLDDYTESDMEAVVSDMKILESEFEKIDQFMDIGDIVSAEYHFDQVLLNYYLPEDLAQETALFADWMVIRSTIITSNRSWTDVTSTELNNLYNMVDQYRTWTGRAAMQVLNEFHNEIFQLPPAFSQQWDPRHIQTRSNSIPIIKVFPNPASVSVIFVLNEEFKSPDTIILRISDVTGRIVSESECIDNTNLFMVDVLTFTNGMYFYEMTVSNVVLGSGKFTVQH